MDFSNPFGIEYRVVNEIEFEGQPARVVSGARSYATSIEDLWDAITNVERIPRWFSPISGDLKLGGKYQLEGNAGGEIRRCDPPERLEITWEYGGNLSWVHVTLVTEPTGTRLTLEHIMSKDSASEEQWKKYGPGATGVGWDLGFMGLGKHLESGEAVDQEASFAWMTTEEGKAFMRSCATAWAEAHIRSGESAGTANAMAEETAKGYCGE